MKRKVSNRINVVLGTIATALFFSFGYIHAYASSTPINPFNATQCVVDNTNESGTVAEGQNMWYYFEAPLVTAADDMWVIIRLTGTQESGKMKIELFDAQLNPIKDSYTQNGNHIGEIVCRVVETDSGTKDVFIPRLVELDKYYIKISGTGQYNLNIDHFDDDYYGTLNGATAMTVGVTYEGVLERDDDIDSFSFVETKTCKTSSSSSASNLTNYMVTVTATKKMNVRITNKYDKTIDSNSLRVMRDRGTSQYVIPANTAIRYFFLEGLGGTHYTISVKKSTSGTIGTWTKVTAVKGRNTIIVKTVNDAKIRVTLNKKIIRIGGGTSKKKVIKKVKQYSNTIQLTRNLRAGDVITIQVTKPRYKTFTYKKIIK